MVADSAEQVEADDDRCKDRSSCITPQTFFVKITHQKHIKMAFSCQTTQLTAYISLRYLSSSLALFKSNNSLAKAVLALGMEPPLAFVNVEMSGTSQAERTVVFCFFIFLFLAV